MQTFYTLYAHKTPRHKWIIYGWWISQTRALMNYLKLKQDAPTFDISIAIVKAESFDNNALDNVKSLAYPLLDIDAAMLEPIALVCPKGTKSAAYDQHYLPVRASWTELQDAGGYLKCEYCGTKMGLLDEAYTHVKL